jgi:O-antigen ligase
MQADELSSKLIKNWQWFAILLLLVLTPLNSKLAGACWLALALLGAWSFLRGSAKRTTSDFDAAKGWVFACLLALALRAVSQLYWGDTWGERHAEFRLLFGALGLLGLAHCACFTRAQLKWLGSALVLALWAGFGLMLLFGAGRAPTNQIPWGASMSLLVCVVLALTLNASSEPWRVRLFHASGVLVGVCAVLLSQARGSYGLVFWVAGVLLWHYAKRGVKWRALIGPVMLAAVVLALFSQIFPQLVAVPAQRVQLAVSEFSAIDSSHDSRFDSSVGARVYLWKRALEEIPDHLLMGVGREVRMASIQRWGEQANSSMVKSLGHLHNNYLEELFDQGLFGLGSFLAFLAGLLYMVMRLRKDQPMAAVGMAGILFMHSSSSLTNVNFAHNYYPTVLSVAVSVCLLLFMRTSGSDDPNLKS